MTAAELAAELRKTYFDAMEASAGPGVAVAMCLFGLRYSSDIRNSGVALHRLCGLAGVPRLGSTVNLGMNLAPYIAIRKSP